MGENALCQGVAVARTERFGTKGAELVTLVLLSGSKPPVGDTIDAGSFLLGVSE